MGGGQEVTAMNALSTFAHHGIIFVPFGYYTAFKEMSSLDEVHGGMCPSNMWQLSEKLV
jgi:NAD(P)H dehydrogenase (quinone)